MLMCWRPGRSKAAAGQRIRVMSRYEHLLDKRIQPVQVFTSTEVVYEVANSGVTGLPWSGVSP